MELKGKVVWIPGGTGGMGSATARLMLEEGAKVMITARNKEKGEALAAELGENCLFVQANIINTEENQAAVKACMEKWGHIDALFVNAGGGADMTFVLPMEPDMSTAGSSSLKWNYSKQGPAPLDGFIRDIYINLIGAFDCSRLAAWEMSKNTPNENGERGVIILTTSISAFYRHCSGFNCGYSSGKAGLLGLRKEMACNLADAGIRVVSLMPGFFENDIVKGIGFLKQDWLDSQIFPKVPGDNRNIATMVKEIITNPFINNTNIEVHAGFCGAQSTTQPMTD